MDEILASIRRIIESSDEKPGASLASNAARVAAADRAAIAQDTAPERPTSFALPAQAARVVPFADRGSVAPSMPPVADDADERWVPLSEPANSAGEPSAQEPAASPSSSVEPAEASLVVEPVVATDRWARELDDVETWSVLDRPVSRKGAEADSAIEATVATEIPSASSDLSDAATTSVAKPVSSDEPQSAPVASTLAVALAPDLVEADAASVAESVEPVEADDDFMVDFDEADFVEAIDRNAALVSARDRSAEAPAPAPLPEAPAAAAPVAERSSPASAPVASRASFESEPAKPATPTASVVREASALMSEQAGTQVAAAFDDLARAIRDGQMKSMEDMAREMLRPMLQDWLDDNLPRLVERLVREEIERVSRGVRR
ncbi:MULTISPECIES: PopZ family protein [unclassified Aureimonas]|uniref:PopZ family protein n=1 Tax=unclassified Aureimonas TaxID=2615206 RepID=UPI00070F4EE8|nr:MULTISPECIES: DUF2497 domain-containing protein [unclassified Aureimonas]KQT60537.1 hypothetical protein ASG62_07805 [Aureimonas sp. Leaf427]